MSRNHATRLVSRLRTDIPAAGVRMGILATGATTRALLRPVVTDSGQQTDFHEPLKSLHAAQTRFRRAFTSAQQIA